MLVSPKPRYPVAILIISPKAYGIESSEGDKYYCASAKDDRNGTHGCLVIRNYPKGCVIHIHAKQHGVPPFLPVKGRSSVGHSSIPTHATVRPPFSMSMHIFRATVQELESCCHTVICLWLKRVKGSEEDVEKKKADCAGMEGPRCCARIKLWICNPMTHTGVGISEMSARYTLRRFRYVSRENVLEYDSALFTITVFCLISSNI